MEKKDFQKVFKNHMKLLGFNFKGLCGTKVISDDYEIYVRLDHNPYDTEYLVEYGVSYAPTDRTRKGFLWDYSYYFKFTRYPCEDISFLEESGCEDKYRTLVTDWFNYKERTQEEFLKLLELNIKKCLIPMYDREYILNLYRKKPSLLCIYPKQTVVRLIELAGLDIYEVERVVNTKLT